MTDARIVQLEDSLSRWIDAARNAAAERDTLAVRVAELTDAVRAAVELIQAGDDGVAEVRLLRVLDDRTLADAFEQEHWREIIGRGGSV